MCVCACIYDMNYVQVSQKMCFHVILFAFVSAFLGILPVWKGTSSERLLRYFVKFSGRF